MEEDNRIKNKMEEDLKIWECVKLAELRNKMKQLQSEIEIMDENIDN